jgi:hypothetical protein
MSLFDWIVDAVIVALPDKVLAALLIAALAIVIIGVSIWFFFLR